MGLLPHLIHARVNESHSGIAKGHHRAGANELVAMIDGEMIQKGFTNLARCQHALQLLGRVVHAAVQLKPHRQLKMLEINLRPEQLITWLAIRHETRSL